MVVLLTITIGAIYIGAAVIARHRAQAAADLGALAAVGRLAYGAEAACAHAAAVAGAMHAVVADCIVDDLDVVVSVDVNVELGRIGVGPARAQARAGPSG